MSVLLSAAAQQSGWNPDLLLGVELKRQERELGGTFINTGYVRRRRLV